MKKTDDEKASKEKAFLKKNGRTGRIIKSLSNDRLVKRTKKCVKLETRITARLLECLEEIESRLLYLDLGYGSLFDFCQKGLGLSEGSAQRRIQAMRLMKAVPEAKESFIEGRLSLSNAARVQSFFQAQKNQEKKRQKQEKTQEKTEEGATLHLDKPLGDKRPGDRSLGFAPQEKLLIVKQIETLSQTACDQMLLKISPEAALPKERVKVVSHDHRQMSLVVSETLFQKLERLKGLLAHSLPQPATQTELLEYLADRMLAQIEKKRLGSASAQAEAVAAAAGDGAIAGDGAVTGNAATAGSAAGAEVRIEANQVKAAIKAERNFSIHTAAAVNAKAASSAEASGSMREAKDAAQEGHAQELGRTNAQEEERTDIQKEVRPSAQMKEMADLRPEPTQTHAAKKRTVWRRAGARCEFVSVDGRRCTSSYKLEIDHKTPKALNGSDTLENLQLLCRAHNWQQAVRKLDLPRDRYSA